MKTVSFIKKEMKSINAGKTLIIMLLLSFMLGVIFIGQLGKLKASLGLNVDGLPRLVLYLLDHTGTISNLTDLIFNIGFGLSLAVYSIYIGLPYALVSYQQNISDGTLFHIMVMPVSIRRLVFLYGVFGFSKSLVMASGTYLLISLPFIVIKPGTFLLLLGYLGTWSGLCVVSLCSILIVTALLWIFNGNKIVINVYKWSVLLLIILLMPLVSVVGLTMSIPIWMILLIAICLAVGAGICLIAVDHFFDKEKIIISLTK